MFKTDRIELRKVQPTDSEIYFNWKNDYDVMKHTNPNFDLATREEVDGFISFIIGEPSSKGYMIVNRETQDVMGIVSLINIDTKNRSAECIIDIGNKDYWGKGFGNEALSLLMNYSFNELNLHRLYLNVFSSNKRAIALYERLGFVHEGTMREGIYREGSWQDIYNMGILQKEFQSRQGKNNL